MKHPIYLIAAVDRKNGLGKNGRLAWRLPKEMAFFHKTTTDTRDPGKKNVVMMGRATWESIPSHHRPLSGRRNIVLTRQSDYTAPGAEVFTAYDEALNSAGDDIETIYVIGGAQIYAEALRHPTTTGVYLTRIDHDFGCDVFFPDIPPAFSQVTKIDSEKEKGLSYDFLLYTKA